MKSLGYKLHYENEPQYATHIFNRQYLANRFRAYRAHPKRYKVTKTALGYQVKTACIDAIAIYERF